MLVACPLRGPSAFLPGHLAVLRVGDGVVDLQLKQAPVFIDQFAPTHLNVVPSYTVGIPSNGPQTLFMNGHAATEGILALSADRRYLALAGFGGIDLFQTNGTPSLLNISRVFCTVDAAGKTHTTVYEKTPYSPPFDTPYVEKMNPRGAVTDGTNHFWGCGNAWGTIFYQPGGPVGPVSFEDIPNSRAAKIIGNTLYVSLNGSDALASDLPAGIFSFVDANNKPAPLPETAGTMLELELKAPEPYDRIAGFDMNREGTIAYLADTVAGIQKYVNVHGVWRFAYNIAIPQIIPAGQNRGGGCFDVAVDFSRPVPVIYATTTEGYGGFVNSNRVVRIVDTNALATATTLAQAGSTNIAYRGIAFTPQP